MGLPAFVVLDRLSAADGGSLIPDGVGLLVQDEAVVDEATLASLCYRIGFLSYTSHRFQ